MKKSTVEELENEIYERRRDIRYDIRDMTVEAIVNKYVDGIPEELDVRWRMLT